MSDKDSLSLSRFMSCSLSIKFGGLSYKQNSETVSSALNALSIYSLEDKLSGGKAFGFVTTFPKMSRLNIVLNIPFAWASSTFALSLVVSEIFYD